MASTYMNDAWLRDTLERQRGRYQKIYGSEAELLKQVCSVLPLTPHAFSSSPYLDSRLYQFDERYISSSQGPRPVPEGAVKFLARGEGGVTRFRIGQGDDGTSRRPTTRCCRLHPSCSCRVFHLRLRLPPAQVCQVLLPVSAAKEMITHGLFVSL